MINLPTARELQDLARVQRPWCVTIYLPYIPANAATNPMQIALKDALKDAEGQLREAGATEEAIQKTLRPGRTLVAEAAAFWPHNHEGMALFSHDHLFRVYRLPADTAALRVQVGRGFVLQPLTHLLAENKAFALLVLDRHATQLYVGDRYHLAPAPLKNFPADMRQTLNIDEFPSWRELHGIAPAYMGKGSEGYHSQYNVAEVNKQLLTQFFRVIDRRLHRYLTDRHLPLIVAGVGYLLPLYRAVNTYRGLIANGLRGSFRRTNLGTLRERAWNALPA